MADHSEKAASEPGQQPGHDDHGHGGTGKYWLVFLGLVILTAMSFGVANTEAVMQTPSVGWTLMMAISCAKAMLVISFFMHLIWEASWKYVLTIPAAMMAIFLVLMLVPDIGNRTAYYSEERWDHSAIPTTVDEEGLQDGLLTEGEHSHGEGGHSHGEGQDQHSHNAGSH